MEKGKLLVETSPRKAHGQHHLDLERASRDSPLENLRTSPRQFVPEKTDAVGSLANVAKAHKRQASAVVPGQVPKNSESASLRQECAGLAQKSQRALAEALPLLNENPFIRDLGQENMIKLASEM